MTMRRSFFRIGKRKWTEGLFRRVVEASVNAIVASERKGKIMIFNEAAERIYGYRAEEVVERMHIEQLYPPGVAREVMQMLRSPDFGGKGIVRNVRLNVIAKDGTQIPISLSGAIVYKGEKEVATIGYFMDLREKLRIQQQMAEIDGRLAEREKEIALAELAGALAHELNQPLTTINSRIFLIEKKMPEDDPTRSNLELIRKEVDRMANIVKRIGQVTSYETKSYAGRAQIIDLRGTDKGDDQATLDNVMEWRKKFGDGGGNSGD